MVKEEGLMTTKPEVAVHYSRGTKEIGMADPAEEIFNPWF